MSTNRNMLQEYIGAPIETILNDEPFKNYKFKKSVSRDLPKHLYFYVCEKHGFEFQCEEEKIITTIFVSKKINLSDRLEVGIGWNSHEVQNRLGVPTKSGKSWDRFDLTNYSLHVSYGQDNLVEMITLMSNGVIPKD